MGNAKIHQKYTPKNAPKNAPKNTPKNAPKYTPKFPKFGEYFGIFLGEKIPIPRGHTASQRICFVNNRGFLVAKVWGNPCCPSASSHPSETFLWWQPTAYSVQELVRIALLDSRHHVEPGDFGAW